MVASTGGFTDAAWTLARVIALLLALLLAQILGLRALLAWRRRHVLRFRAVWEPLLAMAVETFPPRLPPLQRRDVPNFLLIWNFLQESLRDRAKERLNRVARRLGVDRWVVRLVHRRDIRQRLIALTAVGHLRDPSLWHELAAIAGRGETVLSLCAARALLRIDAARAAHVVVPLCERRPDWPAASLASMLGEAGPDAISDVLATAADRAQGAIAPRLIRLLELAHPEVAAPVIRRILERNDDVEVVTACLRVVQDPALLDVVRGRLSDPRWQVRLQAAQALGRMGTPRDERYLVRALEDPAWWVRYRAARALAALPSIDLHKLHQLSDSIEDRYGRDILRQVIAERELAC
jgi:hypothetical protein